MYTVQIEVFEGPMELLLHLVEKNQLDIYAVSIAAITDQFLAYVEHSSSIDLENIGEFMVMASLLMRIKIRQLLPLSSPSTDDEDNLVDEEQALVERLIEYRMFKEVASYLEERVEGRISRVYYRPVADDNDINPSVEWSVNLDQLIRAFLSLEQAVDEPQPVWDLVPQHDVDVDKMMTWLLNRLTPECTFQALWEQFPARRERVAMFLALLELIHLARIEARQDQHRGVIILNQKAGDSIAE